MLVIEHHIQRTIIERLSRAESLRFSELKPDGMESNIFMYHLKQLIKDGYVTKNATNYSLSPKGLSYVDGLSFDSRMPRKQPKIIAIIALRNSKGEWLMSRRKIQPYINQYMLPSGKQHYGEAPEDHIVRELQEQIGSVPAVERRGFVDVRIEQGGQTITHINGHVYTGTYDGPVPEDNEKFSYHFLPVTDEIMVERTTEIIDAIQAGGPFYISFNKPAA